MTVSHSAVGEGARQLAKSGKWLEFRLTTFLVEGTTFLGSLVSGLVPSPFKTLFRWIGRQFWYVFGVLFVFVGRWFRTRHYWHLLGGIPAFLLALPLAYCMIRMPFYSSVSKAKHYRRAAFEAMTDKNFDTANLYYRKLYQLGAMNESAEFQAALNAIERGDIAEGREQIQRLAPEDQSGFPPAHAWIVRQCLDEYQNKSLDDQVMARIERHLQFALDRDASNIEVRALRALYKQRMGDLAGAAKELEEVVSIVPETGLQLASVYARQGRWDAARARVDDVINVLQQRVDCGHQLDAYEFLTWSRAHKILGEQEAAEKKLREGFEQHPRDKVLTRPLYDQSLLMAAAMFNQGGDAQGIVDRLTLAARLLPDESTPLVALSEMAARPTTLGKQLRQSIETLLASDDAPPKLFAVYAAQLAATGEAPRAIEYLRRAIEVDPQDSYSLNNLAYCLYVQDAASDPEALSLVDRALNVEPNQAIYRETRGQLLLRMGRYDEAIDELTAALNALGDIPEIHAALAQAYEKLGNREQAQIHRSRS